MVGLVNADTVTSVTLTSAGAAASATVAGSPYTIDISGALGTGLANYDISYENGSLTVDPAELTVKADDKERSFGAPNPPLTYQITGYVLGETLVTSGVTGAPVVTTTAGVDSTGNVPITVAIGTLSASNYKFKLVNGVLTIHSYQVIGFSSPVDNLPTTNSAKAGQAIPLKFRVLDYLGNPVTSLPYFGYLTGSMSCGGSAPVDLVEEYASGSSGLQNFGNGYFQFNWKTPTNYANSCKTFAVNLFDGATAFLQADFQFKK